MKYDFPSRKIYKLRQQFIQRINSEPLNEYFICDYIKFLLEQYPDNFTIEDDKLVFDFYKRKKKRLKYYLLRIYE